MAMKLVVMGPGGVGGYFGARLAAADNDVTTRGPIGPVRAHPQSQPLLEVAVREAVAVGIAQGARLQPADADAIITAIDGLHPAMMASMCHDLLAHKPLELAGLSGALVHLGASTGVPGPTHTFITQALSPFADGKPSL